MQCTALPQGQGSAASRQGRKMVCVEGPSTLALEARCSARCGNRSSAHGGRAGKPEPAVHDPQLPRLHGGGAAPVPSPRSQPCALWQKVWNDELHWPMSHCHCALCGAFLQGPVAQNGQQDASVLKCVVQHPRCGADSSLWSDIPMAAQSVCFCPTKTACRELWSREVHPTLAAAQVPRTEAGHRTICLDGLVARWLPSSDIAAALQNLELAHHRNSRPKAVLTLRR
mmetsp:Transcript_42267/g.77157  ORF Transcript_42267/g.77157 Transcript_42267/m.77157 type:complete len:227 (-) Transcript_42267:1075-1755(-)